MENIEKAQNLENEAIEMAKSKWDKLSAEDIREYEDFQRVYYPLKSEYKNNNNGTALLDIAKYYHGFVLFLCCDGGNLKNCKRARQEILEDLKKY